MDMTTEELINVLNIAARQDDNPALRVLLNMAAKRLTELVDNPK